eukprot:tig00020553_g10640.t1
MLVLSSKSSRSMKREKMWQMQELKLVLRIEVAMSVSYQMRTLAMNQNRLPALRTLRLLSKRMLQMSQRQSIALLLPARQTARLFSSIQVYRREMPTARGHQSKLRYLIFPIGK